MNHKITAQHITPKAIDECYGGQFSKPKIQIMTGKIISADDKQILSGATIVNVTQSQKRKVTIGTTTNQEGFFTLEASPNDLIRISFVGYQTLENQVQNIPQNIELMPQVIEIEGTTVVAPSHNGKVQTSKTWFWLTLVALGGAIGWYALSPKPAKKVDM